jgi:FkbM family methyltransferase
VNELFRKVPSYSGIFASPFHFGFDESIISTFLKAEIAAGRSRLRVHWPAQLVHWFWGTDTPAGWSWRDGRVFDARGGEHVYLHFQHTQALVKHIDFDVGDRPPSFVVTSSGIESRPHRAHQAKGEDRVLWAKRLGEQAGRAGGRIVRATRLSRRVLAVGNLSWATALTEAGIGADEVRPDAAGAIWLTRLGLRVENHHRGVLPAYRAAVALADRCGARFSNSDDGEIQVAIGGLRVRVASAGEVTLLHDLYVRGIYNWRSQGPTVVLDIGVRSGLTALYFASRPGVTVLGYEPCTRPYERALRNLSLNASLAGNVRIVRAGVGSLPFRTIAIRLPHAAGGAGHRDEEPTGGARFSFEEVDIVDVAEVVRAIREEFPDRRVVVKVAYGRAEYVIDGVTERQMLARLRETRQLPAVHVIMGCWMGSKPVDGAHAGAEDLCRDGFEVLVTLPRDDGREMLYAVRSEKAGDTAAGPASPAR